MVGKYRIFNNVCRRAYYCFLKLSAIAVLVQISVWATSDSGSPTKPSSQKEEALILNDVSNTTETGQRNKNLISYQSIRYRDSFCLFPNVLRPTSTERQEKITMLLHSSANYFGENLVKMGGAWDGKISLAVFASSILQSDNETESSVKNVIEKFLLFSRCYDFISQSLHGHVFMVWNSSEACPAITIDKQTDQELNCSSTQDPLKSFNFTTESGMYPVNTARNIARLYQDSEYVLFVDMDQIYSANAEEQLRNLTLFWEIKERKWALTVRRFEYSEDISTPRLLIDLRREYSRHNVYEFHARFWKRGHSVPRLESWMANQANGTHVMDIKTTKNVFWEPMFAVHKSAPLHNEELLYGRDNHVALVLEMCCAGYTFPIVPEVFSVHRGIILKSPPRNLTKKARRMANDALRRFYRSMAQKYPETAKQCLKGLYPKPSAV